MKHLYPLAFLLFTTPATAQLTITDSLNTATLTTLLEGLNVSITNLTVNCAPEAHGQFSGVSEVPISNGLVLSTGRAEDMAGAVGDFRTSVLNRPGDPDLTQLVGGFSTFDACVLEFDCVPLGDTLLFNFSFGSEEYPEFVGAAFNDAFAIWLTGPGFPIATNVAEIPGGVPVSINTVNATTNPAYFVDNQAIPGQHCAYDGFTQNLTAFAVVQPGATYHFKIAVSDVSDMSFDSGVFLEAFSFRSVMGIGTSIAEASGADLQVVNTAEGVRVLLSDGYAGGLVRVFNTAGAEVLRARSTGPITDLTLNGVPSGIYVVRVNGAAGELRERFLRP